MTSQRYKIIKKLDAGGMAEVWKGKATSLQGFEKLVAIKRVLPELAEKEQFLGMFLDEARLSLGFNHANIVQTFDIGRSGDAYFIVMEWIDGINLKVLLEESRERQLKISVAEAVFIAAEVSRGLSYAHNCVDVTGQPLKIVHRDVSPPNVLISREGEVKLVDFGLAKAATQALPTEQGMVKGKFSYLSPEAAFGEELDARADLFAVGIILWEMLAGRKLFDGENNREIVLAVRAAEHPPLSPINPAVDRELESIIGRALAQDRAERYQSAEELCRALTRYLFQRQLFVDSFAISTLVQRLRMDTGRHSSILPGDELEQVEEELISFTSLEQLQQSNFSPISQLYSVVPEVPRAEELQLWDDESSNEEPLDGEGSGDGRSAAGHPGASGQRLDPASSPLPSHRSPAPELVGRPLPPPAQGESLPQVATIPRMALEIPEASEGSEGSSTPMIATQTTPLDIGPFLETKAEEVRPPAARPAPVTLPDSAFGVGLTAPPTQLPQRSQLHSSVTSARHAIPREKRALWPLITFALLLLAAGTYAGLYLL